MRRISMSKIKEVLRLTYLSKLSSRQVKTLTGVSQSTVLYPESLMRKVSTSKPHPDWNDVHNELKQKGMTRQLLWEEYKKQHPDGYGITQFNEHYSRFKKRLNPSMRQIHYAGDKLFVDFSGLTIYFLFLILIDIRYPNQILAF